MKKSIAEKYQHPKYFRAYWIVTTQQLSRIEAKVDMIQYELCKGGEVAGLPFLDPKRKSAEEALAAKYSNEVNTELSQFLEVIEAGELDARDARNKKKKKR